MESVASSLSGCFLAFLLKIIAVTSAMSLDIQIEIQVPNTEGLLVECTSGGWKSQAEIIWRDSRGDVMPHSLKFNNSKDGAGLLYLKRSIFLKNNTQGPFTCCIRDTVTGQEKRRSVVIPDVLFKPKYTSLMAGSCVVPVTYLFMVLFLHCLRIKDPETKRWRVYLEILIEFLCFVIYIAFLPVYLTFRSEASIVDEMYPLYHNWLWDICTILFVMMLFFTILIFSLFFTLNVDTVQQENSTHPDIELTQRLRSQPSNPET